MSLLSSDPYTLLNDRVLWNDGDSSYFVEALRDKILLGEEDWANNFVFDIEDFSVDKFNKDNPNNQLKEKQSIDFDETNLDWVTPEGYLNLDIKNLLTELLMREFNENEFTLDEKKIRAKRVNEELKLWSDNNKIELLKTLVYIVDVFRKNDIVWGTGRGSSCCSYVLYLVGVHDVDSVYYDLDILDFFRT
jgi:DNA polymerase III alpha subunit